jgi:hypothetical protein
MHLVRVNPWYLAFVAFAALAAVIASTLGAVALGGRSPRADKAALECGEFRWPVKTMSDPSADSVNLNPNRATVSTLASKPRTVNGRKTGRRLTVGKQTPRTTAAEFRTYRVRATLSQARHVAERDRDIHLVILDPSKNDPKDELARMIVELPDVRCSGAADSASPIRTLMRTAREDLEHDCGKLPTKFVRLSGTATITGVGFWDARHGQNGIAQNGIELHPVLRFQDATCRRAP